VATPEEEEEAALLEREGGTREGGREAWPLLPAPLGRSRGSEGAHREKVRRGEDVGRVGVTEKVRKGRLCGVGCVERNDREKTLSP
jgi:hypothetical protein